MREVKRVIEVSDYEHRVMMEALNDRRNDFISENKPSEDVSDLLLKVIDAPSKRKRDLSLSFRYHIPHILQAYCRDESYQREHRIY